MEIAFRKAVREDTPLILQFIRELSVYERLEDQVTADEATLENWLFDRKTAEVLFVMESGKEVGYALYFYNFSTFLGRSGFYLEDLYVRPEHRGRGYGKALFRQLAGTAVELGLGRIEWSCLNWNRPSIDFYLSLGAQPQTDWTQYRLQDEALRKLAGN